MLRFLSLKTLRERKLTTFLCVLSIGLSLSLFLIIEKLRDGIEEGFSNSISSADLIVGARSGPLQLLLYTVFHMGTPTNNITIDTYNEIKKHPATDWTIPISLGDSYKGFRVVATDINFYKNYRYYEDRIIRLDKGYWGESVFEVTLGSEVAKKLKHKLNDSIVLSHGIEKVSMMDHDDKPFSVVGILKPTGTPIDKSVYISLQGMEALHVGWGDSEVNNSDYEPTQITSFILRTKSRIALLGLQRYISTYKDEALSAIIPGVVLNELWKLLDHVENAFFGVSIFVIFIGFFTVLIALYMSLDTRKYEIQVLRTIGASSRQIFNLLLIEAFSISFLGAVFGLILHYFLIFLLGPLVENQFSVLLKQGLPTDYELIVICIFVFSGTLFGLFPGFKAYRNSSGS